MANPALARLRAGPARDRQRPVHGDDREAIERDGWDYDMAKREVPKATLARILRDRGGKGKAPAKSAATGLTKALSLTAGNQGKWPHPSGRKGDKVSVPLLPLRRRSHCQCSLFPHPLLLPHQCGLCGALWTNGHHHNQFKGTAEGLQRDGCIHKYLQSGSTDYDHCTHVGKAIRASQEGGGLEAILRRSSHAEHGSVNVQGMTKAEKTAYDTAKKKASRARKKAEFEAAGKVWKSREH